MARVLGLDIGERRIGIAISTPEGSLAVPLRIIESSGDPKDAAAIAELAASEGAERIVVGHPISMDGTRGPQAQRTEAFAGLLEKETGLPVDLCDERLSTAQARKASGAPRGPVDDIAASIILQAYLDRHVSRLPPQA